MARKNLVTVPAGKIYYDPDGNGEIYFGATKEGTIKATGSNVEVWNPDVPISQHLDDVQYAISRVMEFAAMELADPILAMFINGSLENLIQTSGSATEVIPEVIPGRWYQLGISGTNPSGLRDLSSINITNPHGGGNALTGDCFIDAKNGRFKALPQGGFASGSLTQVNVSYSKLATTRSRITVNGDAQPILSLRFIADNASGENRNIWIPNIRLRADGELKLKGDGKSNAEIELMFTGAILDADDVLAPMYIDGEAQ